MIATTLFLEYTGELCIIALRKRIEREYKEPGKHTCTTHLPKRARVIVHTDQPNHTAYHKTHQLNVQHVICLYSQIHAAETAKDFAL